MTWLSAPHKTKLQEFYDPANHLVSFSLRAAEKRIKELRQALSNGQTIEPTDSDFDTVQDLLHNATELKSRDSLDAATNMLNKAIELGTLVHGPDSQIVRQSQVLKLTTLYENKKYQESIALIEEMQKSISPHTLYFQIQHKALLYSILGESNFHLKNYEKARADLLEALNNWEEADKEKEAFEPAIIELKALSISYFADCFFQDGMWEESIKYYKKAADAWKADGPPMSDYNQALCLFKQSLAESHLNDNKQAELLLKQATDILHRYPQDFAFCQTEVEMTQISARMDQEHGNWLAGVGKFIMAGLAKNRTNNPGNKTN